MQLQLLLLYHASTICLKCKDITEYGVGSSFLAKDIIHGSAACLPHGGCTEVVLKMCMLLQSYAGTMTARPT